MVESQQMMQQQDWCDEQRIAQKLIAKHFMPYMMVLASPSAQKKME